jgi:trigger factor
MQVSVESIGALQRRLTVEVAKPDFGAEYKSRLAKVASTVRLNGFRPGKVPRTVVERQYGEDVRREILLDFIRQQAPVALEQVKLIPVEAPELEILSENDPLSFVLSFEVMPDITLAPIESLEVVRYTSTVSDSDIDSMIQRIREQRGEWHDKEGAAAEGDRVTVDFVGTMNGEKFSGGSAEGVKFVIGKGAMIADIEHGVVGASAGDALNIDATFPSDYRAEDLAGKLAQFSITVKKVEKLEQPELDAAFVQLMGVASGDMEEFRNEIRRTMEGELKGAIESRNKNGVLQALLAANTFEVPRSRVTEEANQLKQQYSKENRQIDLPLSVFESEAERRVKLGYIVGELIKVFSIKFDEEQINARLAEISASYTDPDEVKRWFSNPERRRGLELLIIEEQAVEKVLEKAKVTVEEVDFNSAVNRR